jgi:NAD(P)-dependent dehydrogenase (short-subunit alcohol dehydrogenase family)
METNFSKKTAIVTGGSFGIGKATAIAFAKAGANVIVADVIEDNETVDAIQKAGGKAVFVKCDVSKEEDVIAMVKAAIDNFGRLDYAFNNAGIEGTAGSTIDCTNENWERTLGVNLTGVWYCMKHQIPEMLKSGDKTAIVNCASIAGLVGFPGLPAYVASKHAMVGLTKTTALEFAKSGLRVNAVCPGVIRTPMIDRFTGKKKEAEQQFINAEPIGRMGEPEEVADAVLFLCSEKSSFITGTAMAVDGGWIAQ